MAKSDENENLGRLMALAQEGDAVSYRKLLGELGRLAAPFAQGFFRRAGLGGEGEWEDSVQEILLAVHSKRHTYDPRQPFLPWFYAIARYRIIDRLRARKRMGLAEELDPESLEAVLVTDPNSSSSPLAERDLETLLAELPEKQRQILMLVKVEGLSVSEAAAKLGISASDVKVSVHRAIKKLRERNE